MLIDPNLQPAEQESDRLAQRASAWMPFGLPGRGDLQIHRWGGSPTWVPPGTRVLTRHVAPDGRRVVTSQRTPPRGFDIEFDLGVVHVHSQPGTIRLLSGPGGFITTRGEGGLAPGYEELGHVETAALPMLTPLEVRRVPRTGELTLVCGTWDPLFDSAEHVRTVGFVDGYPIEPRRPLDTRVYSRTTELWRTLDDAARRHRYTTGEDPGGGAAALGRVSKLPRAGHVPLVLEGDVPRTPLLDPRVGLADPGVMARWAVAPLGWSGGRKIPTWAVRATLSRTRSLPSTLRRSRRHEPTELLGYIASEARDGLLPLFAAAHPVVGDVFLTRSQLEATDMGYRIMGILGYVPKAATVAGRHGLEHEVKWASRFGQGRRYAEAR